MLQRAVYLVGALVVGLVAYAAVVVTLGCERRPPGTPRRPAGEPGGPQPHADEVGRPGRRLRLDHPPPWPRFGRSSTKPRSEPRQPTTGS